MTRISSHQACILVTTKLILCFTLLLSLQSCAPPPMPNEDIIELTDYSDNPEGIKAAKRHIAATKHLNHWRISGAIAASNQHKNWTASIHWEQRGINNYIIHLYGPLGGGSVIVEKRGNIITYQDGPKKRRSTNIDELFYKETGVRVPLHNLYYWVRGVPAPGNIQDSIKDEAGHFMTLQQNGYKVEYSGYKTILSMDLPTKIKVTGPGGRLKLVIKNWQF